MPKAWECTPGTVPSAPLRSGEWTAGLERRVGVALHCSLPTENVTLEDTLCESWRDNVSLPLVIFFALKSDMNLSDKNYSRSRLLLICACTMHFFCIQF